MMDIWPLHFTTMYVEIRKFSWAGLNYIESVDDSWRVLGVIISVVTSIQATTLGNRKPCCPCWQFTHVFSITLILCPASTDLELSVWEYNTTRLSEIADKDSPNQIILRIVIVVVARTFPEDMESIPPTEKVNSMIFRLIETSLLFGNPKLTWL